MLHYSYPPRIGGVEVVIDEMSRVLRSHGHEVIWLDSPSDPRVQSLDVLFLHNMLTMPFAMEWTRQLWALADRPDAPRIVAFAHDLAADNPDYAHHDYSTHPWSLLKQAHPKVHYVTISPRRQEQFRTLTGKAIDLFPLGTDIGAMLTLTEPVASLAEEAGLWERFPVLLHPARMVRRKNIELGVRLMAALCSQGLNPALLVTGPPDWHNSDSAGYATWLTELVAELGVESSVLFLHARFRVESADLHALYRLSDALFFPSRQEGFGLPMIEAPLHRLPVFCSSVEPMRSLAPPGSLLFDPDIPPDELASQMQACMRASPAIESRRRVIREHGWNGIYERHLKRLLGLN